LWQYPYRDHRFWDSHEKAIIRRHIIKHHVHASADDVLITDGTGMTGVVNKFQRILGLKVPENLKISSRFQPKRNQLSLFRT
jgi:hypothetical protein